jgi:hypothetical protein
VPGNEGEIDEAMVVDMIEEREANLLMSLNL